MWDKIFKWSNVFLIALIVIGYIYFKRSLNESIEKQEALQKEIIDGKKAQIEPLKEEVQAHIDSLNLLKHENELIRDEITKLRVKLSQYEEIRYYDDIDFDRASSIITDSHYRHTK